MNLGNLLANNYLIKQLPKATAYVNTRMQIVHASDKFMMDFDFDQNQDLGKPLNKLFKKANKSWQKTIASCIKGTTNTKTTLQYIDFEGNKNVFELHTSPWYDLQENIIGIIIQTDDITQKKSDEKRYEKLQLTSEQISDVAQIGFWDYNLEHNEMYWSDKTRSIYEVEEDYQPNFVDTTSFFKIGHSRNTFSMYMNKAITNEVAFREKVQLITARNTKIWVIISGKPHYKNEKFIGLIGTIQNINALNLAEVKQQENEHLLRTLIDNLPVNVFIKDLESRKILVNKAEAVFCGAKNESELLGTNDFDFYDKKTAEATRNSDLTVMRDLKPILSHEREYTKLDGTTTTLLSSKLPLIDADGHAYGLVGFSLDISELKGKERELRKLIKVTSTQNERLVNFAHIVSHNLRSHCANFSMLVNFLNEEESEFEKQQITKMLISSSNNLMETLDNLNEVVDINTKKEIDQKSIFLKSKIKTIVQSLSADVLINKAKIINNVSANIKIKVIPAYIDSIISNFLTNSIKYKSPERDPVIKLIVSKEENYQVLSIIDNGLGIDLDKYGDKLFGMYKTFHDNEGARGIGLYITKNQIEAMNGKVEVTSQVGVGTTFKIYFNENI